MHIYIETISEFVALLTWNHALFSLDLKVFRTFSFLI